jgi:hypothetical protein
MSKLTPVCNDCGQHLAMRTDAPFGYGKITWEHEKPCVRPDHPPVIGYCSAADCEMPVYGDVSITHGPRQIMWCSEKCRKLIARQRAFIEAEQAQRYNQLKRRIKAGIDRRDAA